ncbi:MAG TPA: 3-isopropylmalate dehydratase small subunit [Bacteroidetes bacterium]|nr:3-isopropylmalate dehydratase small subunit [Bacteroidota bacterium]
MAQFTSLKSRVVPLLIDNIDTDQIIPARFLKSTDKLGLGGNLFADWRYDADGSPRKGFALNDSRNAGAAILLAGDNFGCGSSREHAPWALTAYGFRAVISTSFADIFRSNSLKNGLLPVVLTSEEHKKLQQELADDASAEVAIGLEQQSITFPSGARSTFPIDPFSKFCLLNGVDELEYLRRFTKEVEAYETTHSL